MFGSLATEIAAQLSQLSLAEIPVAAAALPAENVYLAGLPFAPAGKLIGREQELALLDLAFAAAQAAAPGCRSRHVLAFTLTEF